LELDRALAPVLAFENRELALAFDERVAVLPVARAPQLELAVAPAQPAAPPPPRAPFERPDDGPGGVGGLDRPLPQPARVERPGRAAGLRGRAAREGPGEAQRAHTVDLVAAPVVGAARELELHHRGHDGAVRVPLPWTRAHRDLERQLGQAAFAAT